MTTDAVDTDFSEAVWAAARGEDPQALVDFLLSERPIRAAERNCLARLISGEMHRSKGKPTLLYPERQKRRDAVARLKLVKAEWRANGKKQPFHGAAIEQVAKEFKVTVEELDEWYRTKKHDQLLKSMNRVSPRQKAGQP
jgi:hypothetical protein